MASKTDGSTTDFNVSDRVIQELRKSIAMRAEEFDLVNLPGLVCPRCPEGRTAEGHITRQGTMARVRRDTQGRPIAVVTCPACGARAEREIPMASA